MKERTQPERQAAAELEQATHLLLDMAGDSQEHISMPGEHGKKYTTIHKPLTATDIHAHLTGTKTLGATLQHTDGTTRALCFDTDDTPTDSVHWSQVQEAADVLIALGYKPLLEPSPAGRGGHLWLIFTERVNAHAAYTRVCELAPKLKDISEHWPGRGGQKVRLPAGRYVTLTFAAWTQLYNGNLRQLATTGQSAAAILLAHQTPADLIPPLALIQEPDKTGEKDTKRHGTDSGSQTTTPTPDEKHRQKYGEHQMWVEWPDEQYLIDLFNSEHTIDELATYERNGMINAATIGRHERTASVGVTKDGQHFTDFGKGARREDGTQDGGDPFEFYIRSQNLSKSAALHKLGQQLNKEASRQLLQSARVGELPPQWVMDILTDKGKLIYNENAEATAHPSLEEHLRGLHG